uniref:Dynein heavy chain coiled coil stalk domain-containing protein n=1 Tax=Amphimedon queenslandica TaxID=400682 RepID=A0A1X7SRD7_AMPQE
MALEGICMLIGEPYTDWKSIRQIIMKENFISHYCSKIGIITELETLKEEAAEVQRKMEETDTVMAEVDRVSQQYLPLSTSCSAMYFTLESLNQ